MLSSRQFPRFVQIVLTGVFLLASGRLRAWDDWLPINPDELKMTVDPAHPADAIILYHEETSDDNRHQRTVYIRVKVLTERGRDHADVETRYSGRWIHIIDIKARTIAPDGSITPFTGKAYDKTIAKGRGIQYLAKSFTLPNVQVGSIIEWKYTESWDDTAFYAPHWTVQRDLFQKRAKFTFIPYSGSRDIIDSRGDVKDRVYYSMVGLPENTTPKTTVNNRMELELKDIPPFEEEDFAPPVAALQMRVNFYYGTDKMGKPADFWKEQGKYWNKDADRFISHSSDVVSAASQAVSAADTPEQKVRKIYALVEKMKNLTYVRPESRLEEAAVAASNQKRTLEDVLRRNEGSRDELTKLFVAMVRAVDVPVYLMRVADRDEIIFQPTVPNPYQLTSEIAIVSLNGKDIFLDPGTPMCPFGTLAWQHTATQGIRQTGGGGTELAQTPATTYKDAISKRVGRMTLKADGSLSGRVIIAWAGEEALTHRLNGIKTDDAGRKKYLEDELKAMLPQSSEVHLQSITGWDDFEKQLSAAFDVEVPSFATSAGKRLLVPTALFEARARQPFTHGERKYPVFFSFPYCTVDEVQIALPPGLRVENLPQTAQVLTEFGFYRPQRTASTSSLTLNRDFAMGGLGFRPEDYPSLRKFYSGVSAGDSEQVVLTSAPN